MPRKLKPYKVDTVFCSRLRRQVDVMFDRDDKDFYGVVDGQTIRATALQECKDELSTFLNNHKELKWKQEIWVSTHDADPFRNYGRHEEQYAEISFSFYRLEVSTAVSGSGELERPFLNRGKDFGEPEPEPHELNKRELGEDINTISRYVGTTRLPYSDESWRGLMLLKQATEQANKRLGELIKKEGVGFLQNIKPNTLLLASGSKR